LSYPPRPRSSNIKTCQVLSTMCCNSAGPFDRRYAAIVPVEHHDLQDSIATFLLSHYRMVEYS
jgi:hypothetical protein